MSWGMKTCRSSGLSGSFRFDKLRDHFTARDRATLHRDVLHIERGGGEEPLSVILADEQDHQHSAALEWIIIWLIAIAVLFFLVHDIFRLV